MARTSSILRIAVKASRTAKQVQFEPATIERLDAFMALHEKTHGAKPEFSDAINALLDVALSKQAGLTAFMSETRKKAKA
jgi:hypothetical protein